MNTPPPSTVPPDSTPATQEHPLPTANARGTLYGPLFSFSCAVCTSYVSDERPSAELAAESAMKRGAVLTAAGFVHPRCQPPAGARVSLSVKQWIALQMLQVMPLPAFASVDGAILLGSLVHRGLAEYAKWGMRTGGRVQITDAGRRALEGRKS